RNRTENLHGSPHSSFSPGIVHWWLCHGRSPSAPYGAIGERALSREHGRDEIPEEPDGLRISHGHGPVGGEVGALSSHRARPDLRMKRSSAPSRRPEPAWLGALVLCAAGDVLRIGFFADDFHFLDVARRAPLTPLLLGQYGIWPWYRPLSREL